MDFRKNILARVRGKISIAKGWTEKEERQYEHIRDGYLDKGMGKDEAEELAARTVNKQKGEK